MKKAYFIFCVLSLLFIKTHAQYSHADSLMGSITPERAWWDLTYYDLKVKVDIEQKYLKGENTVLFKAVDAGKIMQIDLQAPMKITGIFAGNKTLEYTKDGPSAYFIKLPKTVKKGQNGQIRILFEGSPIVAARPPWDGGIVWATHGQGEPFVSTANQGIGASIWWPCKDHPADEVDSMQISISSPAHLFDVSNGQLRSSVVNNDGTRTNTWFVQNPINNYGVDINIANYVSWKDVYQGEKGPLPLSFYVLPENFEKAQKQFKDVYRMLKAFEYWFGPYPFYEDGYKLVEAPYLGMEHQSSVTYGNRFENGYLGTDLSGTGWGLKWDFIIVHESGHEWFANNLTNKDVADMWIHEGFTNYSENLFTEYYYGKEAGADYVIGCRERIQNDRPIIGDYDVRNEGSSDMYYKGANILHTVRQIVNDDELWRGILRGLNRDFYHQTVTSKQVENYISEKANIDFSKVFDQYLRTTKIPVLSTRVKGKKIFYKWENVIPGFDMPVKVTLDGKSVFLYPTEKEKKVKAKSLIVDRNFYVENK
ncbi:M1 family metallopeptidase [Marinilongibacter aquaticus]|uniref:M1 family metallopeptidase n=1 Tax=Marinilongibacter aquaticus TaxID=2975157 RepID=UPI0021BD9BC4|nr:M1 family metallopeptidase [Marinilongibacter aquaticus]UBM60133.1 M1 family metallopeptidase [Marinilongibacter aquaticus]